MDRGVTQDDRSGAFLTGDDDERNRIISCGKSLRGRARDGPWRDRLGEILLNLDIWSPSSHSKWKHESTKSAGRGTLVLLKADGEAGWDLEETLTDPMTWEPHDHQEAQCTRGETIHGTRTG